MLSFSRSDLAVEKDNINGWIGILIWATTVAFWFVVVFPISHFSQSLHWAKLIHGAALVHHSLCL